MNFLHYLADFLAALFLCNGVPHLCCGLRGEPFPSPFSKPPGTGHSSALTNFFWGAFNLIAGLALLSYAPFLIGLNLASLVFLVGFLLIGWQLSRHFGNVRKSHQQP
jgi:hypothetical protein